MRHEKDNRLQMSETTYKFEWLEPETLEKLVKGAATLAGLVEKLAKLKQAFSKGRSPKRDLKKLGNEIDELRKDFETLIDLLTKSYSKHIEFTEAVAVGFAVLEKAGAAFGIANLPKITKIVISHDARLKTLEASIGARKSKAGRKGKRNS